MGTARVNKDRPITFTALMGGAKVGRHSLLFRIGSTKILFDPGVSNGNGGISGKKQVISGLQYIFLTHAHMDHIGDLINVMRRYPKAIVYATPATAKLLVYVLKTSWHGKNYALGEIEKSANRIKTVGYAQEVDLGKGIYFKFLPAGHMLGSASVLISAPEGNFLLTGDFDTQDRGVLSPFSPPLVDLRALVSEGSLVGLNIPSAQREKDRFQAILKEQVDRKQGVVVALDPLGVFQEYALQLPGMQQQGALPAFPLFINDSLTEPFSVYLEDWGDAGFSNTFRELSMEQFMVLDPLGKGENPNLQGPFCYFAGPASLKRQFPLQLVRSLLRDGGHLFADDRYDESVVWRRARWRAPLKVKTSRFTRICTSNHISGPDLKSLIDQMRPQRTFLVHGSHGALKNFARGTKQSVSVGEVGVDFHL